jgi:hypothetical protein
VLITTRLRVVAGRWLKALVTSLHETSVVFTHTHPTGQELGTVPLFAHTTINISAVVNNVLGHVLKGAMLWARQCPMGRWPFEPYFTHLTPFTDRFVEVSKYIVCPHASDLVIFIRLLIKSVKQICTYDGVNAPFLENAYYKKYSGYASAVL